VGSLDILERPATAATLPAGGGRPGAEVSALLDTIRRETPGEPLWTGVRDIRVAADSVEVDFREDYVDPPLYDVGATKVACLKYREEPHQPPV
jgi:hypothetical protein